MGLGTTIARGDTGHSITVALEFSYGPMKGIAKRAKLVVRAAIAGRKGRRNLTLFELGALGAEAAALGTAAHATFVVAVTLAVGAGIPYIIVWALYAMWRAT